MTFLLGLTGSIGMGKSTTAQMFVDEGCGLWDADAAVHRLYSAGGAAVAPMGQIAPNAIVDDAVSRDVLRELIAADPELLGKIERIVHPLLAEDRAKLLATTDKDIVVFDIPLLFETGGNKAMNATVCVSISAEKQRERVLARGTMSEAQFEQIRAKQMPNDEKCAQATYVVKTDTLDGAQASVRTIVQEIRENLKNA